MAELKQQINDQVKAAMRDKNRERLGTLRLITAAIKQKEVDDRIELDDTQVLAVLDKMSKQLRDSISQYRKAGRDDLVVKEEKELEIVQEFLPQPLDDGEINALIDEAIQSSGASTMKDMGKVMGLLKPKLQGRADMAAISSRVRERLQ
ncbi:MAG: GatB/YqeY domain-containing protein [Gammaproteobacteria bacterium]|nr:GatB/YqeY domain-containing protein [Gammaproteobacteria bacterium]